ncbi:MAG: hypothetical protein RL434_3137 [Pseudomonadota bacterium]
MSGVRPVLTPSPDESHTLSVNRAVTLLLALVLSAFFADAYFFEGWLVAVDALVLGFALIGMFSLWKEPMRLRPATLSATLPAVAGAALGHGLMTHGGLHPALAGALAGTACAALPLLGVRSATGWLAPFYVGVFAGTSAAVILHGAAWVLLAGLMAGVVSSALADVWSGIGGRLGFAGFMSATTMVLLSEAILGNNPPALPMQVIDLGHELAVPLAALSAVCTRLFVVRWRWLAVPASAVPTACVGAILFGLESTLAGSLTAAWYGGSFVGMTQPARLKSTLTLALTAALFGVVLLRLQSTMVGWGGVLGSTACTCVLASLGLQAVLSRLRPIIR